MIAFLTVMIASTALAGPPRALETRGPAPYVPVPAEAEPDLTKPVCFSHDTRGMPTLRACPDVVADLFVPRSCPDGSEALVCAGGGAGWSGWGAYSVALADGMTGWFALDHTVTGSQELDVVAPDLLSTDALVRLAESCGELARTKVMTKAWMGCGETRRLTGYDPAARALKLKGLFTEASTVGTPTGRVTAGDPATTCSGTSVLIGATVQELGALCSDSIVPAALEVLRSQIVDLAAAPDAAQTNLRDVLVEVQGGLSTLSLLTTSLDGARTSLTTARGDLGGVRMRVDDLDKASDDSFVELLTELERHGADIAETFVSLSTLDDRIEGLEREALALREKASVPDADLVVLGALKRDVADLGGRIGRLTADFGDARTRVRKTERQVGFLQGRLAELEVVRP